MNEMMNDLPSIESCMIIIIDALSNEMIDSIDELIRIDNQSIAEIFANSNAFDIDMNELNARITSAIDRIDTFNAKLNR